MKIIFYDVEHGSCCHIITPNGKHILIDVGSKSDSSIVDYINRKYYFGCGGYIDELIITHPHEDHIYDLPKLYRTLPPRVLYRPKAAFDIVPALDSAIHRQIADCANQMNRSYNQPVSEEHVPTNDFTNGGVHFDIIEPDERWCTKKDINTFSCIIVLSYNGYKFVLTGDNPANILYDMVTTNYQNICEKIRDATVLLAPHHGRSNEFCPEFFGCVNPQLTVVSDKSIMHGTQGDTSKLYKGRGAHLYGQDRYVLTTRNDGTISFDVDKGSCIVSFNQGGY